MFQKGIFWTIVECSYLGLFTYYIFHKRIELYIVETMDMERFHWNNGASGKYNHIKCCGTYCTGLDTLVGVI